MKVIAKLFTYSSLFSIIVRVDASLYWKWIFCVILLGENVVFDTILWNWNKAIFSPIMSLFKTIVRIQSRATNCQGEIMK